MRILAFTSIRSDYDLMSKLYGMLHADSSVELKLFVSGAHLSPRFGFSVEHVRSDGVPILAEVETLIDADTAAARLKTASNLFAVGIDIVKVYSPDLIIYAGDREDVIIASMIAGFLGIPSLHFFGGDHAQDGHIDNPVRHATSKLSTMHMVSTNEHRKRLVAIGEPESRIAVIGSVALDKFRSEPSLVKDDLFSSIGAKKKAYEAPSAIFIFHPLESEKETSGDIVDAALQALIDAGFHVFIGAPNTDPGNFSIQEVIARRSLEPEITVYGNLPRRQFVNLMRASALIAGNSSAGLLESATLRIPAINIGDRQKGRLHSGNVIFVEGCYDAIAEGLAEAASADFQAMLATLENVYGDGNSASRAKDLILTTDFQSMLMKGEDPLVD